jgi:hypothetical protein
VVAFITFNPLVALDGQRKELAIAVRNYKAEGRFAALGD